MQGLERYTQTVHDQPCFPSDTTKDTEQCVLARSFTHQHEFDYCHKGADVYVSHVYAPEEDTNLGNDRLTK